jgi:hypothetical protein
MTILYQDNGMKKPVECMLSAIDFDSEILTLTPFPESSYEANEFHAHIRFCTVQRLRLAKDTEPKDNFIKARKYP